jgi:hypothetical protein
MEEPKKLEFFGGIRKIGPYWRNQKNVGILWRNQENWTLMEEPEKY